MCHADGERWRPGISELRERPACAVAKAAVAAIGVAGLFLTRTLYGSRERPAPYYRRLP